MATDDLVGDLSIPTYDSEDFDQYPYTPTNPQSPHPNTSQPEISTPHHTNQSYFPQSEPPALHLNDHPRQLPKPDSALMLHQPQAACQSIPRLVIPGSYANVLRQRSAPPNVIVDSNTFSDDALLPSSATDITNPLAYRNQNCPSHPMHDVAECRSPIIVAPEVKLQKPLPPLSVSDVTGATMATPPGNEISSSGNTSATNIQLPPQSKRSQSHLIPLPNASEGANIQPFREQGPIVDSEWLGWGATQQERPAERFAGENSECSDVTKDVATKNVPPALNRHGPMVPPNGAIIKVKKPRRQRALKIKEPEDMDLDSVRRTVHEMQRDEWMVKLEQEFGSPPSQEVKEAYDRVVGRAKRITEKEKVKQRDRKRDAQQCAKQASRLEASLSRYVKEVLIQCLFVEVEGLVRDRCVAKRALEATLSGRRCCDCECGCEEGVTGDKQ